MRDRLELQSILQGIMGTGKVYYRAPSNMEYPCIKYDKVKFDVKYADDIKYIKMRRYQITLIGKDSEYNETIAEKLLDLPYCSSDRNYISDNLYHDVFTIYF